LELGAFASSRRVSASSRRISLPWSELFAMMPRARMSPAAQVIARFSQMITPLSELLALGLGGRIKSRKCLSVFSLYDSYCPSRCLTMTMKAHTAPRISTAAAA
jgi:hypothetical protein